VIHIKGLGHVLSFKNRKRIGNKRLFLAPKYKLRMDAIIRSIESQLYGISQTIELGTMMGCSQQSWIASHVPLDDSLAWIPQNSQSTHYVAKGEEGATITIERI